jgi:hypothetical protein
MDLMASLRELGGQLHGDARTAPNARMGQLTDSKLHS